MKTLLLLLLQLISGSLSYSSNLASYGTVPSLNYFPSPTLYNFNVHESAQYKVKLAFEDSPLVADNALHAGFQDYYQVIFSKAPLKLNFISLTANPFLNEYVKAYKLKGTLDGVSWFDINNGLAYPGLRNSADAVTFFYTAPYNTMGLRFIPAEYFSRPTFSLTIGLNDVTDSSKFYEGSKLAPDSYQGLGNSTSVAPISDPLPADPLAYRQDKLNELDYYPSVEGIQTRDKSILSALLYNAADDTSSYTVLSDQAFLNTALSYFFDNLLISDPLLGPLFREVNAPQHKQLVLEFFAKMLSGSLDYKGSDGETAKAGMALLSDNFDRLVGLVVKAFASFNASEGVAKEIARRLEFYRMEIIGK